MAVRFAECGSKRFVAWSDLEIELDGLKLKIYDKTEPDVCIEHLLDIYSPLESSLNSDGKLHDQSVSSNNPTDYYNNSYGQIDGKVPTWLIPDKKPSDNIDGLATIWCPTS